MKVLGIDYGTKRVGVAISDDEGSFAFPHTIIESNQKPEEEICRIVDQEKIDILVVGDSRASNDIRNEVSKKIDFFVEKLKKRLKIPIFLERESFSSFEAHRYQTKKGHRDDSAAAIILQRYLDQNKK